MANYEQTRYDYSGANLQGLQGINTGIIVPWTDASLPSGFLECDGTAVSRSTYATLFAVIGTTYGSGDGSTTFTLPNLQDNAVTGNSPTKNLASTGGVNTVSSTGNIGGSAANTTLSTPQIPSHNHYLYSRRNANPDGATMGPSGFPNKWRGTPGTPPNTGNSGSGDGHSHNLSANFTGDATSVVQPYLTLIYIIKT
jgi:microcystin-dependent protein